MQTTNDNSFTVTSQSQHLSLYDDEEDFQVPLTQTPIQTHQHRHPLKPMSNTTTENGPHQTPSPKNPKVSSFTGKENVPPINRICEDSLEEGIGLDFIESSLESEKKNKKRFKFDANLPVGSGYLRNSVESRLMRGARIDFDFDFGSGGSSEERTEELDVLLKLCADEENSNSNSNSDIDVCFRVDCPLCGADITDLSEEQRQMHTNECLDKGEEFHEQQYEEAAAQPHKDDSVLNEEVSPVVKWLRSLGLEKYEQVFVREEVDWDTLHWLTEEDLIGIGVTTLGPRKKIVHALNELRRGRTETVDTHVDAHVSGAVGSRGSRVTETRTEASSIRADITSKVAANKLITDYFPYPVSDRKKVCSTSKGPNVVEKSQSDSGRRRGQPKSHARKEKDRNIPLWCQIPGTPFRVDAFKYLRRDCTHWFLTHFHMDHYQGLTKSFCHGKIYCSSITAKLVNMKIGIPWDKIEVLPLNEKINIAGTGVTFLDANHCPGSVIILFEPPNGKVVLHTGDFRFGDDMANSAVLQMCRVNTLILDTTYCNPQYDFPKQEAVIQFVLDAIQAETFNPKTLFLIGSYTIGKERLFLEVARVLRRKVYVTAPKFRLLQCLGFSEEDMQWFTLNELESQIHVVPMWTLASFKRLKHVSNQYKGRFSLIVAFSPTGWTFGKNKKKSPGRRWQQGTIIRYEVPYSEHCSFTELQEFVKLISPDTIIPSVNNDGPDSANAMISLLSS